MTKAKCIYEMDALELIENKELCLNNLTRVKLDYKMKEADLLINTDFKELKLTNESMRKAYINKQLSSEKEALESFENSLTIVNDLLKLRLIELSNKGGETQ